MIHHITEIKLNTSIAVIFVKIFILEYKIIFVLQEGTEKLMPILLHTTLPPPPRQSLVCSLYLWVWFCFIDIQLCCILDPTYKSYYMVFVFFFLTMKISRSIRIAANGIISFFFGLNNWVSQMALVVKNLPANAGDKRDMGSIPGSGGHANPLQYS